MNNREKEVLLWVEKNIFLIVFLCASLFGIIIRFTLRDVISSDSSSFLLPWYIEMKNSGGIQSLNRQIGNYNMLYQFLIAIMTYLPIPPLYAYKILSCLFDFLLAGLIGVIVYDLHNNKWEGMAGYIIVIFSPIVFLNSAAWAQCDSIYTFFSIFALFMLIKERYILAFVLLGVAFAFKLQAIFILPVFLFVYFVRKKISILYFVIIPVVMCALALPNIIIGGRKVSDIFLVYFDQTSTYEKVSMNYPSFWNLLCDFTLDDNYTILKNIAMIFTIIILGALMVWLLISQINLNRRNILYIATLLIYTVVIFLPAMHERYSYILEILSLVLVFVERRTVFLTITLHIMSLLTYGHVLFERDINIYILSYINIGIYLLFVALFTSYVRKESKSSILL